MPVKNNTKMVSILKNGYWNFEEVKNDTLRDGLDKIPIQKENQIFRFSTGASWKRKWASIPQIPSSEKSPRPIMESDILLR